MNQQPLRGRADVMGRLLESMRYTLRTGRGSVAVVTGSVGLGKSSLVGAAAREAARLGFTVGCARADSADADWPLAPLLCALRTGTVPVLSAATMQGLAQQDLRGLWLVDAVAAALAERAAEGPVLLALDDVDQADPLSQLALRQLPGRLAAVPVVWLLAGRSMPSGIGGMEPDDSPGAGVRVELGPLSGEAIEQLATDRLNRALDEQLQTALRAAQGNPRLAVALLADPSRISDIDVSRLPVGADPDPAPVLPERLLADVRAMLSPLPPEALDLLRAGAVLGACFTSTGAARLLSQTVEVAVLPGIEPLVREGLLADDGTSLTFRHELVRRAVYADVPPTLRRAMHRAAARHLAASADGVIEAAGHLLVGADPGDPKAVELLQRAALASVEADPPRAAQFALAAFRLLDTADPVQRMDAGRYVVRTLARAGRPAEAVALAEQVSATGPAPEQTWAGRGADNDGPAAMVPVHGIAQDDTAVRSGAAALHLEAELIEPLWQLGRLDELRIRAQRRLTDAALPSAVRPLLLAQFALGSSRATDQAPGRAAAAVALVSPRCPELPSARPLALLALGELDRAAGHHAAALDRFRARRHAVGLHCVADEIGMLFELDRFADAAALIERVEAALEARPDPVLRTVAAWARARYSLGRGELGTVHCVAAAIPSGEPGTPEAWHAADARLIPIELALSRGDPAAAQAAWRAARDAVTGPVGDDGSWEARLLLLEGRIASEGGGAAVAVIGKAVAAAAGARLRWCADWTAQAARLAVRGGDLLLAEQISVLAEETAARNPGVPSAKGVARLIRGMIAADATILAEAVGELRRGPRRVALAHALADCGTMLLDAGDRTAGVSMLDEAGALLMETGAVGGLLRVQGRLRAAGVRRRWAAAPTRPEHGWAALTEAEQKIARRVADGLSNKAVAADLYISVNTVSTHLRAVFAKLGVNSRAQMTRVALTHAADGSVV